VTGKSGQTTMPRCSMGEPAAKGRGGVEVAVSFTGYSFRVPGSPVA
jgi:hypothetical protein